MSKNILIESAARLMSNQSEMGDIKEARKPVAKKKGLAPLKVKPLTLMHAGPTAYHLMDHNGLSVGKINLNQKYNDGTSGICLHYSHPTTGWSEVSHYGKTTPANFENAVDAAQRAHQSNYEQTSMRYNDAKKEYDRHKAGLDSLTK